MHSLLNNIAIQVVNAKFASERHTTKTDGSKGRADIVLEKNSKGVDVFLAKREYFQESAPSFTYHKCVYENRQLMVKETAKKIFYNIYIYNI